MRVNLCRRRPQIVAAWYSALKLNLSTVRFRGNTVLVTMPVTEYILYQSDVLINTLIALSHVVLHGNTAEINSYAK